MFSLKESGLGDVTSLSLARDLKKIDSTANSDDRLKLIKLTHTKLSFLLKISVVNVNKYRKLEMCWPIAVDLFPNKLRYLQITVNLLTFTEKVIKQIFKFCAVEEFCERYLKLRGGTDYLVSLLTSRLLFLNKPWLYMTTVKINEQYLMHGYKKRDAFILRYVRRRFTKKWSILLITGHIKMG